VKSRNSQRCLRLSSGDIAIITLVSECYVSPENSIICMPMDYKHLLRENCGEETTRGKSKIISRNMIHIKTVMEHKYVDYICILHQPLRLNFHSRNIRKCIWNLSHRTISLFN
jgi:hypothetical protein